MSQVTKLSFKGQSIYVGIDVHLKKWYVTILSDELELFSRLMQPSPKVLACYLKKMFPGADYHSAYEAGYCGFWIHEQLVKEGIRNIVVNPADVPTKDKEKKRKNDPVDSRKIARSLRNGELESIYIPDKAQQEDKSLIRFRNSLVKRQTSCKNQIKSKLAFFGIKLDDEKVKSHWSKAYIECLRKVATEETKTGFQLEILLDTLTHDRQSLAKVTKQIRVLSKTARYAKKVELLCTIPGVSVLTSMTILTHFGDIKQYSKLNELCSYVGLVGDEHSSSDKEKKLGITKRGSKHLKKALVESSWIAVKKDPALLLAFNKYTSRVNKQKSIIKICRKLLNRIRYVLLNEQEYRIQVV